jgi:hypothetical protein
MSPPIVSLTASTGGWVVTTASDQTFGTYIASVTGTGAPAGSWKRVWYRSTAWTALDQTRGALPGRSDASPATFVVLPPPDPPVLSPLLIGTGPGAADVIPQWTCTSPVARTPLGPHQIAVRAVAPGTPPQPPPGPLLSLDSTLDQFGNTQPASGSGAWIVGTVSGVTTYRTQVRRAVTGRTRPPRRASTSPARSPTTSPATPCAAPSRAFRCPPRREPGWFVGMDGNTFNEPQDTTTTNTGIGVMLETVAAACETPKLMLFNPPAQGTNAHQVMNSVASAIGVNPPTFTLGNDARIIGEVRRECFASASGLRDVVVAPRAAGGARADPRRVGAVRPHRPAHRPADRRHQPDRSSQSAGHHLHAARIGFRCELSGLGPRAL